MACGVGLVVACGGGRPGFHSTDITGVSYASDLQLTDHNGQRRTLADFRGKVITVFFGFTHCPDVCPTALAEMKQVVERLGDSGKQVQVLFVTVDPDRDTPEILARYVPAFHADFLGLTGSAAEIAATAKEFKVFYQKSPGKSAETYTMDHTAATYVFDPQGRLRLFVRPGQPIDQVVADFRVLLSGG